jgi:hypothetical protein
MNKPKRPQKKTPGKVQKRDFFQTPPYAIDLLVPYIPKSISVIWEPACGNGMIVRRLLEHGYGVAGTDLSQGIDFLEYDYPESYDAIITNPPFSLKFAFYKMCLNYGKPFALLVPTDVARWNLDALVCDGAQWLIPTRRIDYITPTGKVGKDSQAQFHSGWLTWGFNLLDRFTIVELSLETKKKFLG